MRYGLEAHAGRRRPDVTGFPVQSSVLDEEALLQRVVNEYEIPRATCCRFFCRGDSDIYRVTTTRGEFYLKVYRPPHRADRSEAEARFVADLARRGVPVVLAVPRTDGAYVSGIRAPEGVRPALLFEEAPADSAVVEKAAGARKLGRAVAELHEAADALDTDPCLPTHDGDSVLRGRFPFAARLLPDAELGYLEGLMGRIRSRVETMPRDAPGFGPCHGDLVPSNVRQNGEGRITFFDFGNASRTWRSWELAVLRLGLRRHEGNWEALLAGYEEVRGLPAGFEETLPVFVLLRRVAWLTGVLASCPLRLGVQDFGSRFVDECLSEIRDLSREVGWTDGG
jgi:Ser/Thr protein kinase RdoA (MazF antagonist)